MNDEHDFKFFWTDCHNKKGKENIYPDMEFGRNGSRIGFWVINFTPTNIVYYGPFHQKNNIILKKKCVNSDFALVPSNLHIKPPVLHLFTSYAHKQKTKNSITRVQKVNLQETANVHS